MTKHYLLILLILVISCADLTEENQDSTELSSSELITMINLLLEQKTVNVNEFVTHYNKTYPPGELSFGALGDHHTKDEMTFLTSISIENNELISKLYNKNGLVEERINIYSIDHTKIAFVENITGLNICSIALQCKEDNRNCFFITDDELHSKRLILQSNKPCVKGFYQDSSSIIVYKLFKQLIMKAQENH